MRHVVFRLQRERYALPLAAIREVLVATGEYTRVPRAPASMAGVINVRGRVVPVVDLHALLGIKTPVAPAKSTRVVLLDRGRRELGLLITDVDGIEFIESVGSPARPNSLVRGLARIGALAVTVLDPDGLDSAVALAFTTR